MQTFKQFLAEAVVKSWDVKSVKLEDAINFLNTYCKDGLKAVQNGGLMFRGDSKLTKDFQIIDTTKSLRTSRDSNNAYQLMMDNSTSLTGYPSRSNSLICSSSIWTALEHGEAVVIIPVDGTRVAVSSKDDFFNVKFKGNRIVGTIDINEFFENILFFFKGTGVNTKNGKFQDINAINSAMKNFTPEELTVLWNLSMGSGSQSIKVSKTLATEEESDASLDLSIQYTDDMLRFGLSSANRNAVRQLGKYIERNGLLTKSESTRAFYDFMKTAPYAERATALSSVVMTPESLSLKLVNFGDKLDDDKEVWFSGKCIAINKNTFADILLALKKNGIPVAEIYSGLRFIKL
jgi:hypothetical protein